MFYSLWVVANLEVWQTQVIVQLGIIRIYLFWLLEGSNGKHKLLLLIHTYAIIEECLPWTSMIFLKMTSCDLFETDPVLAIKHTDAQFLESNLFLEIEWVVLRRGVFTFILSFWFSFIVLIWLDELMKSSSLKLYWIVFATASANGFLLRTRMTLVCGVSYLLENVTSAAGWIFLDAISDLVWFFYSSCWTSKCLHCRHGEMNLFWFHCFLMHLLY